jgi:hypothetical protein
MHRAYLVSRQLVSHPRAFAALLTIVFLMGAHVAAASTVTSDREGC